VQVVCSKIAQKMIEKQIEIKCLGKLEQPGKEKIHQVQSIEHSTNNIY